LYGAGSGAKRKPRAVNDSSMLKSVNLPALGILVIINGVQRTNCSIVKIPEALNAFVVLVRNASFVISSPAKLLSSQISLKKTTWFGLPLNLSI
jgi:hypothetical protein